MATPGPDETTRAAPRSSRASRALVTGASGFVGGWLARRLREAGHEVRAIVRDPSKLDQDLRELDLDVRRGDVGAPETLEAALEGVDVVYHLAGLVAHSRAQRPAMEKVNVEGTRNVVEACAKRLTPPALVHLSSISAVGASFDGREPLTEESPYNLEPLRLAYGETKREGERVALDAARAGRLRAVSLNPGTIYGPGDAKKGSRSSMLKVAQGRLKLYPPGGVNVIDVDSVALTLMAAAERGRSGERYLIGGENLLVRDVFRLIAEAAGVSAPWIALPAAATKLMGWIGDWREARGAHPSLTSENAWSAVLYHWFDSSKARRELGLAPKPARLAIQDSVRWSQEHGLLPKRG